MLSDRDGILHHYLDGHKAPTIATHLREEGVKASRVGILSQFEETGSIGQMIGSSRPSKITVRD